MNAMGAAIMMARIDTLNEVRMITHRSGSPRNSRLNDSVVAVNRLSTTQCSIG